MSTTTVTVRADCPVCEATGVLAIEVDRYAGCRETGGDRPSPAEPPSDDYVVPEVCSQCGAEFTGQQCDDIRARVKLALHASDHPPEFDYDIWYENRYGNNYGAW